MKTDSAIFHRPVRACVKRSMVRKLSGFECIHVKSMRMPSLHAPRGAHMRRLIAVCFTIAVLTAPGAAQTKGAASAKKLELKDLPQAVQKTVQGELKGADIRNIGRETEDGVAQYETETTPTAK